MDAPDCPFDALLRQLRAAFPTHFHSPRYGHLRAQVTVCEPGGGRITNLALYYATPQATINSLNVAYDHVTGCFASVTDGGELTMASATDVAEFLAAWIRAIPPQSDAPRHSGYYASD